MGGSRSPRDDGAAHDGSAFEGSAFDDGTAFGGSAFHGAAQPHETAQGPGGAPGSFGDPGQYPAPEPGAYSNGAYPTPASQLPGQGTAAGGYPGDPGYGEPYAPYAQGNADYAAEEYADPYSTGQYAADPYAQSGQYYTEESAYATSEYEQGAYNNAAPEYAEGAYAEPGRPNEFEHSEYPAEFDAYGRAAQYAPEEALHEEYQDEYAAQYAQAAPARGRRGRTRTAAPGEPGFDGGFGAGHEGYEPGFEAEFEAEFDAARRAPGDDLAAPGRFPGPRSPEPDYAPRPEPVGFAGEQDDAEREPAAQTRGRAARRPFSTKPRVSLAGKAVRGLVLAALIGGVVTYVAMDKTITLSVDGSVSQIHSFDSTVGAVLAAQKITTDSHDLVSPSPTAHLSDDSTITVRYGRPVTVTVNGTKKNVWVHGTTVDSALQELGVRTTGAKSSMSMTAPIGRAGATFSVYTMRHITFLVDGKTLQLNTTAATVTAAMAQAGITLHNQDAPSVAGDSVPTANETITILRITGSTETQQVSIPYTVDKENDPTSYQGVVTVVTAGQDGTSEVTYAIQTINGVQQPPKQISQTVTKQPVTEVEKIGTEALPSNAADLDWAALAQCESGGNPEAVDPSGTYYGLYQFSVGTWESLGGTGLPSQASSAEQTDLAELLYERSGSGQWPVCGHNLFS